MVEKSFAWKGKCGSQYQDLSHYISRDFNLEGHDITHVISSQNFINHYLIIFN